MSDEEIIEESNLKEECYEEGQACKIFLHEPYMTPNNYDIYFDYAGIPSNIPIENADKLTKRLQKLMPLSKKIHLNLDPESLARKNSIHLLTKLKINNKEVKIL